MDKYKIVKRVYLDFLTSQDSVTLKCDTGILEYDGKHTAWHVDEDGKRHETINTGNLIELYIEDGLLVKLPEGTSTLEKVIELTEITQGLDRHKIQDTDRLKDDLGLDSLEVVEFGMECEKEWNIMIKDKEWEKFQVGSVKDIVEYIEKEKR